MRKKIMLSSSMGWRVMAVQSSTRKVEHVGLKGYWGEHHIVDR